MTVSGMDRWFVGSFMLTKDYTTVTCTSYLTAPADVPALTLAATVSYT